MILCVLPSTYVCNETYGDRNQMTNEKNVELMMKKKKKHQMWRTKEYGKRQERNRER